MNFPILSPTFEIIYNHGNNIKVVRFYVGQPDAIKAW